LSGEDNGTHVERAANDGPSAPDVALTLPGTALANPGSQACQGSHFLAVELPQFGHVAQHRNGREETNAGDFIQAIDLLLVNGGSLHGLSQLLFHGVDLVLQMFTELGLLFADEGIGDQFTVLASPDQLFLELSAPIHQGTHLGQGRIGFGRGRRPLG